MMGSLQQVGMDKLAPLAIPLGMSWAIMLLHARDLNQFLMGDDIAASRGVDLRRLQWKIIGAATVSTASVVALVGPIGFVGLIVPHSARLIFGSDHRVLLPLVAVWGAIFLVVCDWLTRLLPIGFAYLAGRDTTAFPLPIGVMTAIVGAPCFLFLLRRRGSQ
jgi:iron complex transport system permease protein